MYAYPTDGQPFPADALQPGTRIEPGVLVSADVDYDRRRARLTIELPDQPPMPRFAQK